MKPNPDTSAAIVLGIAATAMPFAPSLAAEAESIAQRRILHQKTDYSAHAATPTNSARKTRGNGAIPNRTHGANTRSTPCASSG